MISRDNPLRASSKNLLSEYLKGGNAKNYMVRVSSGTTRKLPQVIVRKLHVIEFGDEAFERPIVAYGSLNTKFTRIINGLNFCKQLKSAMILIGEDLDQDLERLIVDFRPDSMWGNASFVARIAGYMRDKDILNKIQTLRLSGELITDSTRGYLQGKFNNARIITTYGSTATGHVGTTFGCPYQSSLARTYYHPPDGATIEIADADAEGVGEILLSKDVDTVSLKRYQTGDLGRVINESCLCGAPLTFEILGRKDFDFIRLVGATLHQKKFDQAVEIMHSFIKDYRVIASEDYSTGLKGKVVMQVIPTQALCEKASPVDFLEEQISSKIFLTPTRTLHDLAKDNLFLPLQIELVKEFPSQHKNIKIKRI